MEAESTAKIPRADVERYHATAVELADAARRIVAPAVERGFEVETKPDAPLVTDIDHAVERRLRELIGRWFPDHGVIGEEYPPTHPESAFQWILDPIDGTEEFVYGVPTFGGSSSGPRRRDGSSSSRRCICHFLQIGAHSSPTRPRNLFWARTSRPEGAWHEIRWRAPRRCLMGTFWRTVLPLL